jgi:PIN domain nuclease of toxin-antitoxin system
VKIILDTHMFLWALGEPEKLTAKERREIETLANIIYVSAVSITEIIIKTSLGKLDIPFDPVAAARESGFELLDFSAEDALPLKSLPYHHKDPFDRMLIAQAQARKCYIMSRDGKFGLYECKLLQ